MEHQKILNLLNEANYSKFVTREQNIINNQSNAIYDVNIYNTEVSKFNLCGYSRAYILVRGVVIITTAHNITISVAFQNSS